MTDFTRKYLELLRRQVEEEMSFLNNNGHTKNRILNRCSFCYECKDGSLACNRLTELTQFHSNIVTKQATQLHSDIERKRIGYEDVLQIEELDTNSILNLKF